MGDIQSVWEAYTKQKSADLKERLILEYAPLVKFVAGKLSLHMGQYVDFEDLVSYGIFGLIDAVDKFDYKKGVKFETYASLRIRGSIIDSIRQLDWVPRTMRRKNKQLETIYAELETKFSRPPTDEEIAEGLNIPPEQAKELIKKYSVASVISYDEYLENNHEPSFMSATGQDDENPQVHYDRVELRQILKDAIEKLSEKEKTVITLSYFEDLTLKEISRIMGVSESRVSQIHSKAVLKLQARLCKSRSLLFENR